MKTKYHRFNPVLPAYNQIRRFLPLLLVLGLFILLPTSSFAQSAGLVGITPLEWSPNGDNLAIGLADGSVRIWNKKAETYIATLKDLDQPITSVAWSPDGANLAAGTEDGTVQVWDTETWDDVATLPGPEGVSNSNTSSENRSVASVPTAVPTTAPATAAPTTAPTTAAAAPTVAPTTAPTVAPTTAPTAAPAVQSSGSGGGGSLSGRIAFSSFEDGNWFIYVMNADGSDMQKVRGSASQPALSADGERLAFRNWESDNRSVSVMDTFGGNFRRLSDFHEDMLPAWSPDGKTIVFASRRNGDRKSRIHQASLENANEWNVGDVRGEYPIWSSSGNRIIYRATSPQLSISAMNPDGADIRVAVSDGDATAPALSPDRQTIAYMTKRDGSWEVYRIDLGSDPVRLTSNSANDGLPAFSPDGQTIAFASDRSGYWAIWLMNADGSNQRELVKVPGTLDGYINGEPDYSARGWVEERISWAGSGSSAQSSSSTGSTTTTTTSTNTDSSSTASTQAADPCDGIPAPTGGYEVSVRFVNESNKTAVLYWIDESSGNQQVEITKIAPGQAENQDSYKPHRWIIKDESGGTMLEYANTAAVTQCAKIP